jgi:hypothetical protein
MAAAVETQAPKLACALPAQSEREGATEIESDLGSGGRDVGKECVSERFGRGREGERE